MPLPVFSSRARSGDEAERRSRRSYRNAKGKQSEEPLRNETVGKGNPGCRVVSVGHLLASDDAPLVGIPSWVGLRLGCREENPQTPQPW